MNDDESETYEPHHGILSHQSSGPEPQLYRISEDPSERRDVAEEYPEVVGELAGKLEKIKNEHR